MTILVVQTPKTGDNDYTLPLFYSSVVWQRSQAGLYLCGLLARYFAYEFIICTLLGTPELCWKGNIDRQRRFFDMIAHQEGFHPTQDSLRWYDFTSHDIVVKYKVCACTE